MPHRDVDDFLNQGQFVFFDEQERLTAEDMLRDVFEDIGPGSGRTWADDPRLDDFWEFSGLTPDSPLFWEAFREWYD